MSELRHADRGDCGAAGNGAGGAKRLTGLKAERIAGAQAPAHLKESEAAHVPGVTHSDGPIRKSSHFEYGKVTPVETETRQECQYRDLPDTTGQESSEAAHSS